MSYANKNLVRRHFEEIWNQRKMAACDELMADDFSEHSAAPFAATAPGKGHGPTAMRGHSVEVLYRVYAHCIDGEDERWYKRMEEFLG
jgi:hypothetical protein